MRPRFEPCGPCAHEGVCIGARACQRSIETLTAQLFRLGDGRLESAIVGLDREGRAVYSTTLRART